jgi:apolipoprotein N-acyltransferase
MFPWPMQSAGENVTDEEILAQVPLEVLRDYGNESAQLVEPFRTEEVQKSLASHAHGVGAALVIGVESWVAEKDKTRIFNAAAFVRPDLGYIGRYDKIHRVIFGEYIPLRDVFPWLHQLTPFGAGFGIDAGNEYRSFEYGDYSIVPMICFEDTVPHLVRRMAAQKDSSGQSCDVLVNLTNDAWFRGSSELDQHLITSAFRCVETRMPLVRAVNGGISAFIDGNGEIRDPATILMMKEPLEGVVPQLSEVKGLRDEATGHWRRQFSGIVFGEVPLDPRESLYVRYGDWFAGLCLIVTLLSIVPRKAV